ncbi:MAG: hypothetical protein EOP76_00325 [Variovorax sp.]|nr:MAG: hypothetical protein EOP76_00325 [Variovorax sp.]
MMADAIGPLLILVDPQRGGVRDFADTLAARLGADARVEVFEPGLAVEPGTSVLLQYSGYGYARYGAPLHLLAWVRRERARMRTFGVFFHEAYTSGEPVTSSAFWVAPLQKYVAFQLARNSDYWLTNIQDTVQRLQPVAGAAPHRRLPVFSTVGEPEVLPDAAARERRIINFGSEHLRAETYRVGGDALFRWAAQAQCEIHDIGAPIRDPEVAATLKAHRVHLHGRLPSEAIHELMGRSMFGVVRYPPGFVAKSSVFAAYCAHGLAPVLLWSGAYGAHDGLQAGTHYLAGMPQAPVPPQQVRAISRAAFDWYSDHSVGAHAAAIRAFLQA